jgi:hypothetical protein
LARMNAGTGDSNGRQLNRQTPAGQIFLPSASIAPLRVLESAPALSQERNRSKPAGHE